MSFIKETINALRVCFDGFADKTPLLSTVNNLFDLFQKWAWQEKELQIDPRNSYYTHLKEKSTSDCIWLLVPVIGNIYVYIKQKPLSLVEFDKLRVPNKYDYAAKYLGKNNDIFFERLNGLEQLSILRKNPSLIKNLDANKYAILNSEAVNQILKNEAQKEKEINNLKLISDYLYLPINFGSKIQK